MPEVGTSLQCLSATTSLPKGVDTGLPYLSSSRTALIRELFPAPVFPLHDDCQHLPDVINLGRSVLSHENLHNADDDARILDFLVKLPNLLDPVCLRLFGLGNSAETLLKILQLFDADLDCCFKIADRCLRYQLLREVGLAVCLGLSLQHKL